MHDSRKNTAAGTAEAVTSELPPAMVRDAAPAGEPLIRRRFAAAGIDLMLLCCGVLLLGQVQWMFASLALGLFMARDWDDGYSPGKRVFKVQSKHNYAEIQVDAVTGKILSVAWRPSDLLEALHDGSYYADWLHATLMPISGIGFLFVSVSGLYLWLRPALLKRKKRLKGRDRN